MLAIGFLLVILSSALWHNYLPLLVVATYVIAPVPNWICSRAQSSDDFMDGGSSAVVELGRFITGFLVVMGVGMSICCNLESLRSRYLHNFTSSPHCPRPHWPDQRPRCRHVNSRRSPHLLDHHQLLALLPRRRRILDRETSPVSSQLYPLRLCSSVSHVFFSTINRHITNVSFIATIS